MDEQRIAALDAEIQASAARLASQGYQPAEIALGALCHAAAAVVLAMGNDRARGYLVAKVLQLTDPRNQPPADLDAAQKIN